MAALGQLGAQRGEVLDDAVVDDGDPAGVVQVRVGVGVGRAAVGGPAGVPDAGACRPAAAGPELLLQVERACRPSSRRPAPRRRARRPPPSRTPGTPAASARRSRRRAPTAPRRIPRFRTYRQPKAVRGRGQQGCATRGPCPPTLPPHHLGADRANAAAGIGLEATLSVHDDFRVLHLRHGGGVRRVPAPRTHRPRPALAGGPRDRHLAARLAGAAAAPPRHGRARPHGRRGGRPRGPGRSGSPGRCARVTGCDKTYVVQFAERRGLLPCARSTSCRATAVWHRSTGGQGVFGLLRSPGVRARDGRPGGPDGRGAPCRARRRTPAGRPDRGAAVGPPPGPAGPGGHARPPPRDRPHPPLRSTPRNNGRDHLVRTAPTAAPSTRATPYVDLTRAEWSALRDKTPLPLTAEEVEKLRGLGDVIDLDEVRDVYLPLSRLLNLYVRATAGLRGALNTFLGERARARRAARHPVRHRGRRQRRGRQVHHRPPAPGAAGPLARAPAGRAGHHRRLPAADEGAAARAA